MTTITDKEHHFNLWFSKNYRPHPDKKGCYIDKVIKGALTTMEGAKRMHDIIYKKMKEDGIL